LFQLIQIQERPQESRHSGGAHARRSNGVRKGCELGRASAHWRSLPPLRSTISG